MLSDFHDSVVNQIPSNELHLVSCRIWKSDHRLMEWYVAQPTTDSGAGKPSVSHVVREAIHAYVLEWIIPLREEAHPEEFQAWRDGKKDDMSFEEQMQHVGARFALVDRLVEEWLATIDAR